MNAFCRAREAHVPHRTPAILLGGLKKHCFLQASKEDRRGFWGDVRLARAAECIQCIAATDMGSDTPLAARRIGSEPLVRLALNTAAIASYIEEPT